MAETLIAGLSVASALTGAVGSVIAGQAQNKAAKVQAIQYEQAARTAEENAQRASYKAQVDAQENDRAVAEFIAQMEADQGASGTNPYSDSPLQLRRNAQIQGRLDSSRLRQDGDLLAQNYRSQSDGYLASANLKKADGAGSALAGWLKAGTLIGDAVSPFKNKLPSAKAART